MTPKELAKLHKQGKIQAVKINGVEYDVKQSLLVEKTTVDRLKHLIRQMFGITRCSDVERIQEGWAVAFDTELKKQSDRISKLEYLNINER